MTAEQVITSKPFKLKATAMFVPILAIASLLVPLFMEGLGKPTIGERLSVTYLLPWYIWLGMACQRPFLTAAITMPVLVLLGAGIWRPSKILFLVSLLGIVGLWLFLVWLSWIIKYA